MVMLKSSPSADFTSKKSVPNDQMTPNIVKQMQCTSVLAFYGAGSIRACKSCNLPFEYPWSTRYELLSPEESEAKTAIWDEAAAVTFGRASPWSPRSCWVSVNI